MAAQYGKRGLMNGYNKNNKERAELDYYATPTAEVINVLEVLNLNLDGVSILEPCVGGGHMMEGIKDYCEAYGMRPSLVYASDYKDRGYNSEFIDKIEYGIDTLADDYPFDNMDYVIMNPPYSTLEPFILRALDIANKGALILCRIQVLESISRYNHLHKEQPPTIILPYIDRIGCIKNGVENKEGPQMYCWLYYDKTKEKSDPIIKWIWSVKGPREK